MRKMTICWVWPYFFAGVRFPVCNRHDVIDYSVNGYIINMDGLSRKVTALFRRFCVSPERVGYFYRPRWTWA